MIGISGLNGAEPELVAGFGPKQARNLWQCLGVTLY
jgi:hypothetical protein